MTAAVNGLLVFALGMSDEYKGDEYHDRQRTEKTTTTTSAV
jgi:hypothetical protein